MLPLNKYLYRDYKELLQNYYILCFYIDFATIYS